MKENFPEIYRLRELLGEGRYGTVRIAQSLTNGGLFACKIIQKMLSGEAREVDVQMLDHIRRLAASEFEGMVLVRRHPKVVQILGKFEEKRTVCLITELCLGGDLFYYLSRKIVLSEYIAANIIGQVASALNYCHSLGLIHRDVKPENIFLSGWWKDSSGSSIPQVKLGDFGSCVVLKGRAQVQDYAGTLAFVAPEILEDQWYASEVDIWSLGVVLYLMLRGVLPFQGSSRKSTVASILSKNLKFTSHTWKHVSPEAIELLQWMLNRDPKRRATASDVLSHPWIKKHNNMLTKSHGDLDKGALLGVLQFERTVNEVSPVPSTKTVPVVKEDVVTKPKKKTLLLPNIVHCSSI